MRAMGSDTVYRAIVHRASGGCAVTCLELPGCWSYGATEDDALEGLRGRIQDYLRLRHEIVDDERIVEMGL